MKPFKHDLRSWLFNELIAPRVPFTDFDKYQMDAFKVLNTIRKQLNKLKKL